MSTNFFMPYQEMKDKGLVSDIKHAEDEYEDYLTGQKVIRPIQTVSFKGYEYERECYLNEEGVLHLSCGASFRLWLHEMLKENHIKYEAW